MGVIFTTTDEGTVDQNSFAGTLIGEGIAGENFNDYALKTKIDRSYLEIEEAKKRKKAEQMKQAEIQFNISKNAAIAEKNRLMTKPNLTPEEIAQLRNLDQKSKSTFNDLDAETKQFFATQNNTPPEVAKQTATLPTQAPNAPASGGQGGGTPATPNAVNQYTFSDQHKEYDSTKIPEVLQNGRITPARYFAQNGKNFYREAKLIAKEMGMENYRGTPGENYAIVQYLEDQKNGKVPGGGKEQTRKFDGVDMGENNIPNRFTEEDRQKVITMTPEEQQKYISQRNLDDLRKMLPGNVALINKVFGTNYTSDDLTGGIGRQTIMGSGGLTQAGIEVNRLIEGLTPEQAAKFMSKGGELDNSQTDNIVIKGGDKTIQTGRRKILEEIVDGNRTPEGTSIDAMDEAYMAQYKAYKAEKLVADEYNKKVTEWNNTDSTVDPIKKNLLLRDVQQYVNTIKSTNPQVYASLKPELDRIPEFAKAGKIPTITPKDSPSDTEKKGADTKTEIVINPGTPKNNVPPTPTTASPTPSETPIAASPNETNRDAGGQEIKPIPEGPKAKPTGSSYSQKEYEPNIGYSGNNISRG